MKSTAWFDRLAWGAMTLISMYVAHTLNDMGTSVAQLNTNVAVLIVEVGTSKMRQDSAETLLQSVDKRVIRLEALGDGISQRVSAAKHPSPLHTQGD